MSEKLRTALIGFGGMGHFHATQYANQKYCELVAICDIDKRCFSILEEEINLGRSGIADLSKVAQYNSFDEMVKTERFDMLDICLPGYLHAEYAVKALRLGYHVLTEKPMARTVALADKMIATVYESEKYLMTAQCVRFTPAFRKLAEICRSNKYGKLLKIDFKRLSGPTRPDKKWYRDSRLSGGALLDLHLHDVDFINSLFGVPNAVSCFGITRVSGGIDDMTSVYFYDGGPVVIASSSWCRGKWDFGVGAVFENGTVEVLDMFTYRVTLPDAKPEEFSLEKSEPIFNEIEYFSKCVTHALPLDECPPESTRDSLMITLAEERSAKRNGAKIIVNKGKRT